MNAAPILPWLEWHRSTVLAEARTRARPMTLVRVQVGRTALPRVVSVGQGLAPPPPSMSAPVIPSGAAPASSPPPVAFALLGDTASTAKANVPNAISMLGYAATLAWLAGAPWWLAVAGLAADEIDGRIARATGETSEFGGLLDWAIDITTTGLVLMKLGWSYLLLAITPMQAYLRERGWRPTVGSARALFTVVALIKGV